MTTERLQIEWLVINALRENLALINDGENYSYNETIRFAKESFGKLFKDKDSQFSKKRIVSKDYERYEQKANAISKTGKNEVTAEELIRKDLEDLKNLVDAPENKETQKDQLKKEIEKLKKLLRENEPQVTQETENMALRNDFRYDRPYLKYHDTFGGKYNVYSTKSKKQFTLRFLHPDKPESATGVDLIYEIVDPEKDRVRIIAIQYKLWDKGVLYFSQSSNLEDQLEKSKKCFCEKGYCESNKSNKSFYRLPYCTPFLRPTDKIHNIEKLLTSGWHIPVCEVENFVDNGYKEKLLRLEDIRKVALNTEEFEKLFLQEKIGSRWLTYDELEDLYRKNSVLNNNENIRILSQKLLVNK